MGSSLKSVAWLPFPWTCRLPLCDTWHHSFHSDGSSHLFHLDGILAHSTRMEFCPADVPLSPDISHPEFCPTDANISQPEFCPTDVPLSPDISQPEFCPTYVPPSPDISYPAPATGWERRTIQLPRADMSRSSGNAYSDNLPEQLGSSDTRDSPDPFPPTIKKQTPTILTTKSPELSLIFNARCARQDIPKSSQIA